MKVQILIQDRRDAWRKESLGIEAELPCELTDFWFRLCLLESFWIDWNDKEIVFSIGGDDYRCPYNEGTHAIFEEELG